MNNKKIFRLSALMISFLVVAIISGCPTDTSNTPTSSATPSGTPSPSPS